MHFSLLIGDSLKKFLVLLSIINVNSLALAPLPDTTLTDSLESTSIHHSSSEDSIVSNGPLEIKAKLILHHAAINVDDHEMTLAMDVLEEWTDQPHLAHSAPEAHAGGTNGSQDKRTDYEIVVVNVRESAVLKTLTRSDENGLMMKLTKMQIITSCTMNFFYFPFDKQICSVKIIPGASSDKEIKYNLAYNASNSIVKLVQFDNIRLYPLMKYKISQVLMQDDFGLYNQSSIEVQLMFVRQFERSFPVLYFPVIALMTISCMALYLKPYLHSVCITLASFMTLIVWVIFSQMIVFHTGFTTMLDHYHFLCLNLSLNAVSVSIMIHLFLQSGTGQASNNQTMEKSEELATNKSSESEQTENFFDVKLELSSISSPANGTTSKMVADNDNEEVESFKNDPEAHIRKMGKFKQFMYFKSAKPAKYQLPVVFIVLNIIYVIWILIARLHVPSGFESF